MTDERRSGVERRSIARETVERRRGRPRAVQPLTPVTLWLPRSYADKLDAYALKHDVPVSAAGRQLLILRLDIPTD